MVLNLFVTGWCMLIIHINVRVKNVAIMQPLISGNKCSGRKYGTT